jgi:hypothetical protein
LPEILLTALGRLPYYPQAATPARPSFEMRHEARFYYFAFTYRYPYGGGGPGGFRARAGGRET